MKSAKSHHKRNNKQEVYRFTKIYTKLKCLFGPPPYNFGL